MIDQEEIIRLLEWLEQELYRKALLLWMLLRNRLLAHQSLGNCLLSNKEEIHKVLLVDLLEKSMIKLFGITNLQLNSLRIQQQTNNNLTNLISKFQGDHIFRNFGINLRDKRIIK